MWCKLSDQFKKSFGHEERSHGNNYIFAVYIVFLWIYFSVNRCQQRNNRLCFSYSSLPLRIMFLSYVFGNMIFFQQEFNLQIKCNYLYFRKFLQVVVKMHMIKYSIQQTKDIMKKFSTIYYEVMIKISFRFLRYIINKRRNLTLLLRLT